MSTLNLSEQQDLRIIVESFFGTQNTAHWEMNEELLGVITKMINKNQSCAKAMDFVPRPGAYFTLGDVRKELSRISKRVLLGGGASYRICENFIAWQYKQTAETAGQGVQNQ